MCPAPRTLSAPSAAFVERYLFVSAAFAAAALLCLNTPLTECARLFLHTALAPGPPLNCVAMRVLSVDFVCAMPMYLRPPEKLTWYVYAGVLGFHDDDDDDGDGFVPLHARPRVENDDDDDEDDLPVNPRPRARRPMFDAFAINRSVDGWDGCARSTVANLGTIPVIRPFQSSIHSIPFVRRGERGTLRAGKNVNAIGRSTRHDRRWDVHVRSHARIRQSYGCLCQLLPRNASCIVTPKRRARRPTDDDSRRRQKM